MIYVTHDQSEAMTLGGRIAMMQRGAIVQIGAPLDLYRQPVNTFVGTFLGSPPMNLIDGIAQRHRRDDRRAGRGRRRQPSPAADRDEARVLVVEPMGKRDAPDPRISRSSASSPGVPADRPVSNPNTSGVDRSAAGPRARQFDRSVRSSQDSARARAERLDNPSRTLEPQYPRCLEREPRPRSA